MPTKKRPVANKKAAPAQATAVDLKEITQIVDLMEKKGLSVFHFERGGMVLKLKRGSDLDAVHELMSRMPAAATAPAAVVQATGPTAPTPALSPASAASEPMGPTINSPMVGTFYRSAGQGEKVFVNVGDVVGENSVTCIIEAMKVMNEIKAEATGTIARILVEDGKPVQYGQPLFELKV